jgi:hypothetical protein
MPPSPPRSVNGPAATPSPPWRPCSSMRALPVGPRSKAGHLDPDTNQTHILSSSVKLLFRAIEMADRRRQAVGALRADVAEKALTDRSRGSAGGDGEVPGSPLPWRHQSAGLEQGPSRTKARQTRSQAANPRYVAPRSGCAPVEKPQVISELHIWAPTGWPIP